MNHLGSGSGICCEHLAQVFGTDVVDAVVSQVYMANRKIGPRNFPLAMASALLWVL